MRHHRYLVSTGLALALAMSAAAQDRNVDLRFAAGSNSATVSDSLTGEETVLYRLGAEAGQTMAVTLEASTTATYFNIYEPGRSLGDNALVIGQLTNPLNAWKGELPASGEYTIAVYLIRSAARRGDSAEYTLDVAVTGETRPAVQQDLSAAAGNGSDAPSDVAAADERAPVASPEAGDGLTGGPDLLEVAISSGGSLNMRAEPSTGAEVVARLSDGESLRNLGCRMAEGRRWCRVATLAEPEVEGWTAGDFLVEATGSAPTRTE